jgi:hypothetical protein
MQVMKFIILMYANPAETLATSAQDRQAVARRHESLRTTLTSSGELLSGAGMTFPKDTTKIRLRDGAAVQSSGPLVAAESHLTAFYVVECESTERANAIAEGILDGHVTAVEIRQIHDSLNL